MNDFVKYTLKVSEEQNDIVLAFLSQLPCDMMEDFEEGFSLSFEKSENLDEAVTSLMDIIERFQLEYEKEEVKAQNWNAVWESSFQPIYVGTYAQIRASFHEQKKDFQHDLLIDPQMSFGTGHHATTYMMVDAIQDLDLNEKSVMDYGCGTGILAILAAKEGAKPVLAFDIEENAYENSVSNAKINSVEHISIFQGVLDGVEEGQTFDIILANINRNVILDSLEQLEKHLNPGGTLLISGILIKDIPVIEEKAFASGFKAIEKNDRDGWVCYKFTK